MRVLLANPSHPFEEFPCLLVTLSGRAAALREDGHGERGALAPRATSDGVRFSWTE